MPDEAADSLPPFASEPPATRQNIGDLQRSSQDLNLPPTASLERTVQLMVDQSLKGLKDRLFRSIHPPPPPVDVQNISLPSPRGPPPLQPGDGIGNSTYANHDDFTQTHGAADSAPAVPLCSPTPLPPIPQKVRQRIIQGEYIEFDSLLCEHCSQRGTARAPPPRCHSMYRTLIQPREKW